VLSGGIKSCGCLKTKKNYNKLINHYKNKCKQKKNKTINWLLTKEEAAKLFESNCHYCDGEPQGNFKNYTQNKEQISGVTRKEYNGIDRLDCNSDYSLQNSVTCCKWCNQAKSTLSEKDFKTLISKIYNKFLEREKNV